MNFFTFNKNHFSLLLVIYLLTAFSGFNQVIVKGKVYYDDDGKGVPSVKILKDNFPFSELETSTNGKFTAKLPLGHNYMIEISKPYNYTTKLAVSTIFPDHINTNNLIEVVQIETDLVPHFEDLDGSILNYPVMILKFDEKENLFINDTVYLSTIRTKVEKLVAESEKMEKLGKKKHITGTSKKEMDRIDVEEFFNKSNKELKLEIDALKANKEPVKVKEVKKEANEEPIVLNTIKLAIADEDSISSSKKLSNPSNTSSSIKANKLETKDSPTPPQVEKSEPNETEEIASVQPKSNIETVESNKAKLDTINANEVAINNSIKTDDSDKTYTNTNATNTQLRENKSIFLEWWFYVLFVTIAGSVWWFFIRKKPKNEV